jgi:hypothetical protein
MVKEESNMKQDRRGFLLSSAAMLGWAQAQALACRCWRRRNRKPVG